MEGETSRLRRFLSASLKRARDVSSQVSCWLSLADRRLSCTIYRRDYTRLYWAIVVAIIGIIVLSAWSFQALVHFVVDPDSRAFAELAHPLVLLLGFFGAVASGDYLTQRIGRPADLRTEPPSVPLEETEDPTTKPWGKINHSFPKMFWSPNIHEEHMRALRYVYRKQECFWSKSFWTVFEQLIEETGTINYRALPFLGRPRFIRIYKVPNVDDLRCRDIVFNHLKKKGVFDLKFIGGLEPIPLNHDGGDVTSEDRALNYTTLSNSVFNKGGDVFVHIFPYLDVGMHFTGKKVEELRSIATAFGRLQGALSLFDADAREYLQDQDRRKQESLLNSDLFLGRRLTADELEDKWNRLKGDVNKGSNNPFVEIMKEENKEKQLDKWIYEAVDLRREDEKKDSGGGGKPLFLYDVHPHNVLCEKDECVLILDYTWIGAWPHSWVVAFSLHRFVREYVIRNSKEQLGAERSDGNSVSELCDKGAKIFLEEYRSGLKFFHGDSQERCFELPENFKQTLGQYIRCSNMEKMLGTFAVGVRNNRDILMRPVGRRLGEARKFIRFMKESKEFEL